MIVVNKNNFDKGSVSSFGCELPSDSKIQSHSIKCNKLRKDQMKPTNVK